MILRVKQKQVHQQPDKYTISNKFWSLNNKLDTDLAQNITRLVSEAVTGWELYTPFSKCIDCPAVCNQKLFPVSSSEKCVMQNLGVI